MEGVDYGAVEIAACPIHEEYQGRVVLELASEAGKDPRDWILDLFVETDAWISAVHHALSESDVERVLLDPRVMIGSDGVATAPTGLTASDRPHPRAYGTFPRILARYVREQGLLTWEEAIRRMTSLPARRLGFGDRGRLAPGTIADIVILDPETVRDTATFAQPHSLAVGIVAIVVGGAVAFSNGIATGARNGRVLRRADPTL